MAPSRRFALATLIVASASVGCTTDEEDYLYDRIKALDLELLDKRMLAYDLERAEKMVQSVETKLEAALGPLKYTDDVEMLKSLLVYDESAELTKHERTNGIMVVLEAESGRKVARDVLKRLRSDAPMFRLEAFEIHNDHWKITLFTLNHARNIATLTLPPPPPPPPSALIDWSHIVELRAEVRKREAELKKHDAKIGPLKRYRVLKARLDRAREYIDALKALAGRWDAAFEFLDRGGDGIADLGPLKKK